jgi:hypothetical protein
MLEIAAECLLIADQNCHCLFRAWPGRNGAFDAHDRRLALAGMSIQCFLTWRLRE